MASGQHAHARNVFREHTHTHTARRSFAGSLEHIHHIIIKCIYSPGEPSAARQPASQPAYSATKICESRRRTASTHANTHARSDTSEASGMCALGAVMRTPSTMMSAVVECAECAVWRVCPCGNGREAAAAAAAATCGRFCEERWGGWKLSRVRPEVSITSANNRARCRISAAPAAPSALRR